MDRSTARSSFLRSWLVLALLLVAGCERRREPPPAAGPPLRWHAVRGNRPNERNGATLEVRAPCRVALRYEGPVPSGLPPAPPRLLHAGASVTVTWGHVEATEDVTRVPPAAEREAGRTEPHVVVHRYGYTDGSVEERTTPVWTRPGRGKVLSRDLVPPSVEEDLPIGSRLDLSVVAVVDAEEGEARLVPTAEGVRVRMPSPGVPGDRAEVVRLRLEVLPP